MRRDGSRFWGQLLGAPVSRNDAGAGTIWTLGDVSEERRKRNALSWAATHDALTNIANRQEFESRLAEHLERSAPARGRVRALRRPRRLQGGQRCRRPRRRRPAAARHRRAAAGADPLDRPGRAPRRRRVRHPPAGVLAADGAERRRTDPRSRSTRTRWSGRAATSGSASASASSRSTTATKTSPASSPPPTTPAMPPSTPAATASAAADRACAWSTTASPESRAPAALRADKLAPTRAIQSTIVSSDALEHLGVVAAAAGPHMEGVVGIVEHRERRARAEAVDAAPRPAPTSARSSRLPWTNSIGQCDPGEVVAALVARPAGGMQAESRGRRGRARRAAARRPAPATSSGRRTTCRRRRAAVPASCRFAAATAARTVAWATRGGSGRRDARSIDGNWKRSVAMPRAARPLATAAMNGMAHAGAGAVREHVGRVRAIAGESATPRRCRCRRPRSRAGLRRGRSRFARERGDRVLSSG